ncbi:unnamed protein product [Miscanthus lutarioriparius]|uniref:Uncharacterized protein n=1 Tax=Miscanthus lutarioriparius TaxID=422564 RepID=A0A811SBN5_9POAL|nr:unnamed protein product [Miscanthus lutarioriparius]
MEPGSCSRRSWVVEVEDEEAARSTGRSTLQHPPPLATSAHASFVLHTSSLDPNAEPFVASPGGSRERLHFTVSKASSEEEDEPPMARRGKDAPHPRWQRRRRRHPARRGSFMADAWRDVARAMSPPRRLVSIVVHPMRMSVEPDADEFRKVQSHIRWRRVTPPTVRDACMFPSRCFNYEREGHHERDCPLPPMLGLPKGKHGHSPVQASDLGRGALRRRSSHSRGASSVDTVSACLASTRREPSILPVYDPPTPEPMVDESAGRASYAPSQQGSVAPDDFIIQLSNHEDLELVLCTPSPTGAPFALRWRRWSHLIMGSAGAFHYRVLMGMKGIPSHARSTEIAQAILGSSSAKVELANPNALNDPDDERELFVAAWCAHPDLVLDEIIMALLEPEEEHDRGSPLYLRPHEIIPDEALDLRYLVRL